MKPSRIHSSNFLYLGLCFIGIIAFLLVGIYPNLKAIDEIDEEISLLKQKAQEQELLYPVFQKLLVEITHKIPTKLTIPEKRKISHNDLSHINSTFLSLASKNKVSFVHAIPDASNYLEDKGFLTMNVAFTGDFFNFRNLILDICYLPYLESIEKMQIETLKEHKRISFTIKVAQT